MAGRSLMAREANELPKMCLNCEQEQEKPRLEESSLAEIVPMVTKDPIIRRRNLARLIHDFSSAQEEQEN